MIGVAKQLAALLASAVFFSSALLAAATDRVSLNIESQPLESALTEFARQSGMQLLFVSDQKVLGAVAPDVAGVFQVDAGLRKLLAPSGLSYHFVNATTVAIQGESETHLAAKAEQIAQSEESRGGGGPPEENKDEEVGAEWRRARARGPPALPEVLVSGKRSLNADIERSRDDIQPYVVIDREAIKRSGASDVAELLRKSLPANASSHNSSTAPTLAGNTTSISLRGLGDSQTLVLIDGRRAASYAFSGNAMQPDLNSIPLSAIERIEVLPMSASGIYGGSATGGVLNVILKRDYSGVDLALTHNNTFDSNASQHRVDLNAGFALNGGRTSFLFSGSYSDSNPLLVKDRDFYDNGIQTILDNNPDAILNGVTPPLGRTSNVTSVPTTAIVPPGTTGATCFGDFCFIQQKPDLVLKSGASLNSPIAYVPDGYSGAASDGGAAFLQTGGAYNFALANTAQSDGGGNRSLISATTVKSARATMRQEFSPTVTGFLELSGTSNVLMQARNQIASTFTIPQQAPNNPFNQDVTVTTPALGADSFTRSTLESRRGVGGLIARLPWETWRLSVDHTWDQTELRSALPSYGISPEGTFGVTSGSIDVFRDTNLNSPNFGQFEAGDLVIFPVKTTLNSSTLRVGGSVLSIPGGSIDLSIQAERDKQRLNEFTTLTTLPGLSIETRYPRRSQTIDSLYAELRIPLVSASNGRQGIQLLEFQAAGRFDEYTSDTTNSINSINGVPDVDEQRATNRFKSVVPTVGVRFSPVHDVVFRASYSEGFRPPELTELVPGPDIFLPTGFPTLIDPRRGNEPVSTPFTVSTGGNAELEPETSASKSFGVILTPRFAPGLRLSWDWATIDKKNNVGSILAAASFPTLLQNEPFIPGLVMRAPAQNDGFDVGPILVLNGRLLNFARAKVEEYDWTIDYTLLTDGLGTLSFGGSATQRIHNLYQATPLTTSVESAAQYAIPRWSADAFISYQMKGITVGWATQYLAPYFYLADHSVSAYHGRAEAPSAIYHDLSISYRFQRVERQAGATWLSGTELLLGVKNIFNEPPRVNAEGGFSLFDTRVDPRLASYYVSLRKSF